MVSNDWLLKEEIGMKVKDYEAYVAEHSKPEVDLNYVVIALNEEAGEVAGWYKKAVLRGNKIGLTDDDLKKEFGDLLFYLTRGAAIKGWSLKDLMDANVAKLDERRAKGFRQIV